MNSKALRLPFDYDSFDGFPDPHWTPVPDLLLDFMLPDLSGAELKVILYLIRRTYGFKKDGDSITFSQLCNGIKKRDGTVLDYGTGLAKASVSAAIKSLEGRHLIEVVRGLTADGDAEVNYYRVRRCMKPGGVVQKMNNPSSIIEPGGSSRIEPPVVQKLNTQDTVVQKTEHLSLSAQLAAAFYKATGQTRPSKAAIERARKVCSKLLNGDGDINGDGYSEEAIREAIRIAAERGAHSPGLLEYVIGEAVAKLTVLTGAEDGGASLQLQIEEDRAKRQADYEAEIAALKELPKRQYNALRKQAIERLGGRTIPEPALLGLMVGLRKTQYPKR